jgi:cysteine desulfurase
VGFGVAAELAAGRREERAVRAASMRDRLVAGVLAAVPAARLNGHPTQRLPGNAHFSFAGVEGEAILLNLDLAGIACSSGSACASGTTEPSHVLTAMGVPGEWAGGCVRMTLGEANEEGDVERVLAVLPEVVAKLRRLSPVYPN